MYYDYLATESDDQLPSSSAIGRGPQGNGVYPEIVQGEGEWYIIFRNEETGEAYFQTPNLTPPTITITQPDHDLVPGEVGHFTITVKQGGNIVSQVIDTPPGAEGARIYTLAQTQEYDSGGVYTLDISNLEFNRQTLEQHNLGTVSWPMPRVHDLVTFKVQNGIRGVGIALGNIVAVNDDTVTVVSHTYLWAPIPRIDPTTGTWVVDGIDTGYVAKGDKGDKGTYSQPKITMVANTEPARIEDESTGDPTNLAPHFYIPKAADGRSFNIHDLLYRPPGSSKPLPDLPPFESVNVNDAYRVDDDESITTVDLYYKAIDGTDWSIQNNWGGVPGKDAVVQVGVVEKVTWDQDLLITSTKIDDVTHINFTLPMPVIATNDLVGLVRPDNDTITIDADGVISASAGGYPIYTTTGVLNLLELTIPELKETNLANLVGTTITFILDRTLSNSGVDLDVNGLGSFDIRYSPITPASGSLSVPGTSLGVSGDYATVMLAKDRNGTYYWQPKSTRDLPSPLPMANGGTGWALTQGANYGLAYITNQTPPTLSRTRPSTSITESGNSGYGVPIFYNGSMSSPTWYGVSSDLEANPTSANTNIPTALAVKKYVEAHSGGSLPSPFLCRTTTAATSASKGILVSYGEIESIPDFGSLFMVDFSFGSNTGPSNVNLVFPSATGVGTLSWANALNYGVVNAGEWILFTRLYNIVYALGRSMPQPQPATSVIPYCYTNFAPDASEMTCFTSNLNGPGVPNKAGQIFALQFNQGSYSAMFKTLNIYGASMTGYPITPLTWINADTIGNVSPSETIFFMVLPDSRCTAMARDQVPLGM